MTRMRTVASSLWASLALFALLAASTACAGNEKIVHGLDEYEANEIIVVLQARSISSKKVPEEGRVVTYAVEVSGSEVMSAMQTLVANKLPRQRPQGLAQVYPAGGGGLIPTKSEEKAKYLMALQGEIERKLLSLPGVVRSHVSVVQPDKDIVRDLDREPPAATASVAVVFNAIDERGTSAVTVDEIRNLVAASVEELKPTNVQVLMKRNVPANLEDRPFETRSVQSAPAAERPFGIGVVDTDSALRLRLYAGVLGVAALLGIAVGVGGIVRASGLKRRVSKNEAELTAMRKGTRGTQTGLPG